MKVKENISLQDLNTFGLKARARHFCEVQSIQELQELFKSDVFKENSRLILGGGSNILLTQDFDGLVIKINILDQTIEKENEDSIWIKVGAGVNWHNFVSQSIKKGYGGVENLSLIPGTVGAAPMQNIGAYGVEIKDIFHSLDALDMSTGQVEKFDKNSCEFGYRSSVFKTSAKGKYLITHVTFRLAKNAAVNTSYGAIKETLGAKGIEKPSIKDVSDAVISIRKSKLPDPTKIGNAGSFFKNPTIDKIDFQGLKAEFPAIPGYDQGNEQIKVPAGWLIEQCGWKGKVVGNTGSHKNQALVLVNYGNANGTEVLQLAKDIQKSVSDAFGIELEMEVNII